MHRVGVHDGDKLNVLLTVEDIDGDRQPEFDRLAELLAVLVGGDIVVEPEMRDVVVQVGE